MQEFIINGKNLTNEDVVKVARGASENIKVVLSKDGHKLINRSQQYVNKVVEKNDPV